MEKTEQTGQRDNHEKPVSYTVHNLYVSASYIIRRVTRILHWGHRTEAARVHFFLKEVDPFWSSLSKLELWGAYKTLLVERTVLLY